LKTPAWQKALSIVLALGVWQLVAVLVNQRILLVGPITAVRRVIELVPEASFWATIGFSLGRIALGFALGFLVAAAGAAASYRWRIVQTLLWPYLAAIRSTPVASFIILALIWFNASNLSVIVAFLIVLPVVYGNLLEGLDSTDPRMLELAQVFHASPWQRLGYLYLPSLKPHLTSALGTALGMSWKAGIAAEVIGIPTGSIGERLYQAKIYLSSADLFAWTLVIIALAMACEKLVLWGARTGYRRLEAAG
jgi:NitT/TauT family transport system permease protein